MPPGIKLNIEKELLEKLYIYDRLNLNMIAKYFNTDRNTIARYIKKYNIPKRNHSLYTFNEYFFEKPDILNSYWAGFIAADGCIANKKGKNGSNYLSIGISKRDGEHLNRFKQDIKFSGPITYSSKNICHVRIFSQKICDDLNKNFNITQRKSLTLQPPTNLSDECILSYCAGLIDGDGTVGIIKDMPHIGIINTKFVLSWLSVELRRILNLSGKLGIMDCYNRKTKAEYSYINIYTYEDIKKVYFAVINLNINLMSRKWDKIKNIIENYKPKDKKVGETHYIEYGGETLSLSNWSKKT